MLLQESNTSNHDSINVPYSSANFFQVIMVLKFFLIPAVVKEGFK
jgi:hypothetical protein